MKSYKEKVSVIVCLNSPFDNKVKGLQKLKKIGATQNEVYQALQELRIELPENEDVILELMDFVTGYCAVHMRIW